MRRAKTDENENFLAAALKHPLLDKDEEHRLAKATRARTGGKDARTQARNKLVLANLRFVAKIAHPYTRKTGGRRELDDVFQDGVIGEIIGVDRYDPDRGYRLSTYAGWRVRHHIMRTDQDDGRMIRLPVYLIEAQSKIRKAVGKLFALNGKRPTVEEVAREAGIRTEAVRKVLDLPPGEPLSLDNPVDDEHGATFLDLMPSTGDADPGDKIDADAMIDRLYDALRQLNHIQRFVIEQRFFENRTLNEVGRDIASLLGHEVSRERARQIQNEAIVRLRSYLVPWHRQNT